MTAPVPYRLEISAGARRGLHRLPTKVAAAVIEFVTGPVAENPVRLSKPLTNELGACRSARRGDYRVLIRIDESAHVVLIIRISHRADVYRTR